MLKRFIVAFQLLAFLLVILSIGVLASEDPFDLSTHQEQISLFGIPTPELVEVVRAEAVQLFETKRYEESIEPLEAWAYQANFLANIIRRGLDPFYSAPSSVRSTFSLSELQVLSKFERMSNDLIRDRNLAMVMQAEAHRELGNIDQSFALYMQVLSLITASDVDLWIRAANGLYELVGIGSFDF